LLMLLLLLLLLWLWRRSLRMACYTCWSLCSSAFGFYWFLSLIYFFLKNKISLLNN
jgi:hypothetical protein